MVEVFKTNVQDQAVASNIILQLQKHFPEANINFDLEDCDRVLRIDNSAVNIGMVSDVLKSSGYQCEVLFA